MVAYSFQKRFAEPIEAGMKLHTLRNWRKRHARPDEELQLYTGMRTKHCRLVARRICTQAIGVLLDFTWTSAPVRVFEVAELIPGEPRRVGAVVPIADVEAFATADGFRSFGVMATWWWRTHRRKRWEGMLIGWGSAYPLRQADAARQVELALPLPPAPWAAEPWRWHAPEIATALRRGDWRGVWLRTYRSSIDGRVTAVYAGAAPVWRLAGVDVDHASLEDLAAVLLRLERDAAAGRDWTA